jgi:hypothetical protein
LGDLVALADQVAGESEACFLRPGDTAAARDQVEGVTDLLVDVEADERVARETRPR